MNRLLNEALIYSTPAYPFYQPDFKQVIDSHLEFLKTFGQVRDVIIDTESQGKYVGDFYAILNDMRIPPKYHRVILILNGYTNPIQYEGNLLSIVIPDLAEIEGIMNVYNTGRSAMRVTTPGE